MCVPNNNEVQTFESVIEKPAFECFFSIVVDSTKALFLLQWCVTVIK